MLINQNIGGNKDENFGSDSNNPMILDSKLSQNNTVGKISAMLECQDNTNKFTGQLDTDATYNQKIDSNLTKGNSSDNNTMLLQQNDSTNNQNNTAIYGAAPVKKWTDNEGDHSEELR